jgi:tRNA A37 threonylcarbamoyladenosine dehydratase
LIDKDIVDATNLNRQILYVEEDIGKSKVEIAKSRGLAINKDVDISIYNTNINDFDFSNLKDVDFIIDAVDDVQAKIKLAKFAQDKNIGFISSLGMGNRLNPCLLEIKKLNKTTDDPLARKVRYEFKKQNIDVSKIDVVISKEKSISDGTNINSVMMVPSTAGLALTFYAINYFIN